MALINCPECGKQISEVSEKCVHCGFPIRKSEKPLIKSRKSKPKKTNRFLITFGIIVGLIAIATTFGIYWYIYRQGSQSNPKNDLVKMNLNGKVKILTERQHWVDMKGFHMEELQAKTIYEFNTVGNVIEKSVFDENGILKFKTTNKFGDANNILETKFLETYKGELSETLLSEFGDGVLRTSKYQYNDKNKLINLTIDGTLVQIGAHQILINKFEENHKYEYDERGNPIEEICGIKTEKDLAESSFDESYPYTIEKTDMKGNTSTLICNQSDGTCRDKITYKYNDKNTLIEQTQLLSDGSCLSKYMYKYNDKQLLIEKEAYEVNPDFGSKTTYTETFMYDDKDRLIKSSKTFSESNSVLTYNYKYDDKGNLLEGNSQLPNNLGQWDYDNFDNNGNWLHRITYHVDEKKGKQPEMITEREMVYF